MDESLNHLPVAVPAPAGRSLTSLSDDEVRGLLAEVGPSPWLGAIGVPLFIFGLIGASVGAGTLALWLCIKLGLGSLPTAAAMICLSLVALPSYGAAAHPLIQGLARLSAHHRARAAVDQLALEPAAAEGLKAWLTGRGPRPAAMRRCLTPPEQCPASVRAERPDVADAVTPVAADPF